MTAEEYRQCIKELMGIPGMERAVADDLMVMGINKVSDLKEVSAERLYARLNHEARTVQDRRILYIFRCAVYYASNNTHEEEKLSWNYWKDRK